jgi:hypothetical protein
VPEQQRGVLASDAERERVALVLRDAAAEGRLTLEELSDRCVSVAVMGGVTVRSKPLRSQAAR